MIQAEWDHDTPPARFRGVFPMLTNALFQAVQTFLEEDGPR
jgi:hypothetical protein